MESSPHELVGPVPCESFLVGEMCACVLADKAGSCLSEGQCNVQQYVLGCLSVSYGFGQPIRYCAKLCTCFAEELAWGIWHWSLLNFEWLWCWNGGLWENSCWLMFHGWEVSWSWVLYSGLPSQWLSGQAKATHLFKGQHIFHEHIESIKEHEHWRLQLRSFSSISSLVVQLVKNPPGM